ncbi:MAG: Fe-S protein assembly co-chaperone HscB [Planctomycetota bacterium]
MPADSAQRATPAKCQSCHGPLTSPVFCDSCRSLFPADRLSHFELLGLPARFDLDPEALRQRYLQLSRWVHPDHHGRRTESAEVSLRLSAQLNEAYRVLGDPVLRAEYLLELAGGASAQTDRGVLPDVLSTALALRDEASEARAAGDQATLERCRAAARGCYETTLARITELARRLPGEPETRQLLRATLNSMKYYQKLLAEL